MIVLGKIEFFYCGLDFIGMKHEGLSMAFGLRLVNNFPQLKFPSNNFIFFSGINIYINYGMKLKYSKLGNKIKDYLNKIRKIYQICLHIGS